MALREEEFERLQTQLLELKSNNYSLDESVKRKDVQVAQLTQKTKDLEKEVHRLQSLAKLNPLSFAKSALNRKDAKEKEKLTQLHNQSEQLQKKVDLQEDEFKMAYETLRNELMSLLEDNQKLRDFIELKDGGPEFLKSIAGPLAPSPSSATSSPVKSKSPSDDEFDLGRSHIHPSMSTEAFALMAQKEALNTQVLDLQHDLKIQREERMDLQAKFDEMSIAFKDTKRKLEETSKIAEDRKILIDEMKEHIEESKTSFDRQLSDLNHSHQNEIDQLRFELKSRLSLEDELTRTRERLTKSAADIVDLEAVVHDLRIDLSQSENKRIQDVDRLDKRIRDLTMGHLSEMESVKDELKKKEEAIKGLTIQVSDSIEDRKIHDKKGLMMVKELKRQLAQEKKRADRLQERLQEVLNETTTDLPGPSASTPIKSPNNLTQNDSSSGGSWSFMGSNNKNGGDKKVASSTHSSSDGKDQPHSSSSTTCMDGSTNDVAVDLKVLIEENGQLVSRMTQLQEDKWRLEEKINSLTIQVDDLRKDIVTKGQVIEFYCMGQSSSSSSSTGAQSSGHHHPSVRKVVDFIKDSSNLRDINRKLQRMLEETLTKNMFLQESLDQLSNEVVRLSKATSGPGKTSSGD